MAKNNHKLEALSQSAHGETDRGREILAEMANASDDELVQVAVRAGILTADGKLTDSYRDDVEPSDRRRGD